jgi:hypothetical protein
LPAGFWREKGHADRSKDGLAMNHPEQSRDDRLLMDLRRELERREAERARLLRKQERALSVVESGEDSGFALSLALSDLKRLDERIEQLRNLLAKYTVGWASGPSQDDSN